MSEPISREQIMLQTDRAGSSEAQFNKAHATRPTKHLNQIELSRRWTISPRTLERWRWLSEGPAYLKVGGRVVYRVEDIEAYEAAQMRTTGSPRSG